MSSARARDVFVEVNVYSEGKFIEKLRYMHRNLVKRELVDAPEDWHWSSYGTYAFEERGPVKMDWYFSSLQDAEVTGSTVRTA
jgi:putative transposase